MHKLILYVKRGESHCSDILQIRIQTTYLVSIRCSLEQIAEAFSIMLKWRAFHLEPTSYFRGERKFAVFR